MKTATKKIVLTKKGELSKNITNMLGNCRFEPKTNRIYTGYYSGSGRFTSAHSAQRTVTDILNAQGYKFSVSNDAPRGGASGEYVQMSSTAYNFIVEMLKRY